MRFPDPLTRLRAVALAEGTTLVLLLLVAVPAKYLLGVPQLVSVMGPIHGVVFVLYIVSLVENLVDGTWRRSDVARAVIVSVIPLGTFFNDRWLARRVEQPR